MPLTRHRWPLTPALVSDAPELPGVFVLWEEDELIYIGHAKGQSGLRKTLLARLNGSHPCTSKATHYSWEISRAPEQREREVLAEYHKERSAFPRCNREES